MADLVVDSSVMVTWILPEVDTTLAQRVLAEAARTGARLVALDLAFPEVANAIWKQQYRGLATLDEARQFFDALNACPIDVEAAHRLLRPAFEIAAKYRRAVYDALFVALAKDLGMSGITADESLYHAVHADYPQIVLLRHWQP